MGRFLAFWLFLLLVGAVFGQSRPAAVRKAPELQGSQWLNGEPTTLKERAGKVTIVHFWTFQCSNCHANLAAYDRLYAKYKTKGVDMVGIHTPETAAEHDQANVAKAVKDLAIHFPVLLDPSGANWKAWGTEYWPTVYLVDKRGNIRFTWVGEFGYQGQHGEQEVSKWLDRLIAEPS